MWGRPKRIEISRRKNGDRLYGIAGPRAADLYAAGTPPVWGLAAKPAPDPRVASVRIGDRLRVERRGDRWEVSDARGVLGILRWHASDDGSLHAVSGAALRLPVSGTLHVQRLLYNPRGVVKDIGGYVQPD